jgi:acyl-CoA synthetase (AMP-forming)/AMP-acid ligase II
VQDACVVSVTDEYSGELPLAFIVLQPTAAQRANLNPQEADALKGSIKKHVSDYKVRYKWLDGGVVFIDAIPKNPSGKMLVCLTISNWAIRCTLIKPSTAASGSQGRCSEIQG